jgi:hypothetical protein
MKSLLTGFLPGFLTLVACLFLSSAQVQASDDLETQTKKMDVIKSKDGLVFSAEKFIELLQSKLKYGHSSRAEVSVQILSINRKVLPKTSSYKNVFHYQITLELSKKLGTNHFFQCDFYLRDSEPSLNYPSDFSLINCKSDTAKTDSLVITNLLFSVVADETDAHLEDF